MKRVLFVKENITNEKKLTCLQMFCRGRYMEIDFPIVMEAAAVELMDFVKKGNT